MLSPGAHPGGSGVSTRSPGPAPPGGPSSTWCPSRAARDCGPTGTLPSSAPAQGTSGGRRPAPLQGRGSRASPGQHWVHFLTWPARKNCLTARRAAPPEAAFPVLSPLSTGGGSSTLYRSWCCRDTVLRCLKNMAGLLSFPLDKYLSHLLPLSHSLSEYTLHGNGSFSDPGGEILRMEPAVGCLMVITEQGKSSEHSGLRVTGFVLFRCSFSKF